MFRVTGLKSFKNLNHKKKKNYIESYTLQEYEKELGTNQG